MGRLRKQVEQALKHGAHNQASHGNWAHGARNDLRGLGRVVSTGASVGRPDVNVQFHGGVSPSVFKAAIQSKRTRGAFLSSYPEEEYRKMRLFLSSDKKTGFAIKEDGDLVSVFNNDGVKGAGGVAVLTAIQQGATKLDCFAPFLPEFYKKYGFEESERMAWDDQYAPDGWDYEANGRPDVVFMKLNPDKIKKARKSTEQEARDKELERLIAELRAKHGADYSPELLEAQIEFMREIGL